MRNFDQKRRDIARSVLPSTRRRSARQARQSMHADRRRVTRARLKDWASYADLDECEADVIWDTNRARHYDDCHGYVREERRNGDKLGALMQWARRTAERLPGDDEAKYNYFRSVFGDTTTGRHALSHIENIFDDLPWKRHGYWVGPTDEQRERRRREDEANRTFFLRRLRAAFERDHAELNRALWVAPCLGAHDFDRWAQAIWLDYRRGEHHNASRSLRLFRPDYVDHTPERIDEVLDAILGTPKAPH